MCPLTFGHAVKSLLMTRLDSVLRLHTRVQTMLKSHTNRCCISQQPINIARRGESIQVYHRHRADKPNPCRVLQLWRTRQSGLLRRIGQELSGLVGEQDANCDILRSIVSKVYNLSSIPVRSSPGSHMFESLYHI